MTGKGDTYRPVDPKKWATEWERIFSPRDHIAHVRPGDVSNARCGTHLRHRPEPDTLPKHTQEGHGESDPAERQNTDCRTAP